MAPRFAFSTVERDAVYRAIHERRDIRSGFLPEPLPDDVLTRVLAAAHAAPSVGSAKPWDFLVLTSTDTRRRVHDLVRRRQDAYAATLPASRVATFERLRPDAVTSAPVGVVVTCDTARGGWYTFGASDEAGGMRQSVDYAIENMWLAARAENVGLCMIGAFDPGELADLLALPTHVEVVAYLCLGYVESFPPAPELVVSGWSRTRPLAWSVHHERYGRRGLPGATPTRLLDDVVAAIGPAEAVVLPNVPAPAAAILFAGGPAEDVVAGIPPLREAGRAAGHELCVVDVALTGDAPAIAGLSSRRLRGTGVDDAMAALETGIEVARDFHAAGNRYLAAAAPARGLARLREEFARQSGVDEPDAVTALATAGAWETAALAGLLLGAAALRLPVVTAGEAARAAARVTSLLAPHAADPTIVATETISTTGVAELMVAIAATVRPDAATGRFAADAPHSTVARGSS